MLYVQHSCIKAGHSLRASRYQTPPPSPLKFANCPRPPFLGNPPLCIGFSWFLVMTVKNIFVYKLFLLLNISNFSLFFFLKKLEPPTEKNTPLFSSNPPLKVEVLSSLPLFENLVGGSNPLPSRKGGGGACTL